MKNHQSVLIFQWVEYIPVLDNSVIGNEKVIEIQWIKYLPKKRETLEDNIFNIDGIDYIPAPKINMFSSYSYSRLRWLLHENKIPWTVVKRICNLTLIKKDFLCTLELMYKDPEKLKKQQFQIEQYYWEKLKKWNKKEKQLSL